MRRRNLAVLLLGLAGMLMAGDQAGSPASTLAQAPERRVIFVQGMDSEANCQPNDNLQSVANYLVGHSDGLLSNDDFLGFSYSGSYCSPDPTSEFPNYTPDYSSDFTCGSIDPADGGLGHSQRFGTWFRSLPADGTTYDIVAHSMGGVVVAYWVTELASAEDLAKLHAVITLDSPLLGIAEWQEWAARLRSALGFARCTALDNRYSDMDDDSPVIAAIGNAETVERTPFVTIRNQPDLVVPPDIAYLAGAWLDRLLDDPCDGLIGTNHGCVFTNDVALGTILVAVQQAGETPGEATTGDWPMFGHDPGVTHFNAAEEELTPPLSMFWSVDGLAQGQWPVVSQGVLYIEARFGDLVAIDATTGELLWESENGDIRSDGGITVASGKVFTQGFDTRAYSQADGRLLWRRGFFASGRPNFAEGVLLVSPGFLGLNTGAIDPDTGEIIWLKTFGTSPAAWYAGTIFSRVSDSLLASPPTVDARDALTGTRKWDVKEMVSGFVQRAEAVAIKDGVVFAVVGSSIRALDAFTGEALWPTPFSVDAAITAPAVAYGTVYFGSRNHLVYAVDAATGELKWSYPTLGIIASAPAVANGVVYVRSVDGNLYAFDAFDGELVWQHEIAGGVTWSSGASPVIAQGMLYLVSDDGRVQAFASSTSAKPTGVAPATPTSPAPATPTPTPPAPSEPSGDVSCDRNVNAVDALFVLQLAAGVIASLPCSENGDVNGDGTIDPLDAALILQFSAGLIPSLPP